MGSSGVGQARAPLHLEGAVDKDWRDQSPKSYLKYLPFPFQKGLIANLQICYEDLMRKAEPLVLDLMHESLHLASASWEPLTHPGQEGP